MSRRRRGTQRSRAAWKLIGSLVLGACHPSGTDRDVLDAWHTCVECTDGELDSVKALAARMPETVDSLRIDLLRGLSRPARDRVTRSLFVTYRRMETWVAQQPSADTLPFTQAEFIRRYRDNLEGILRGRAAIALGEIGGRRARRALDEALRLPTDRLTDDLLARIRYARDTLLGP